MKIHHYKKVSLDSIRRFLEAQKSGLISQAEWARDVIGCDPSTFSRAFSKYKKRRK